MTPSPPFRLLLALSLCALLWVGCSGDDAAGAGDVAPIDRGAVGVDAADGSGDPGTDEAARADAPAATADAVTDATDADAGDDAGSPCDTDDDCEPEGDCTLRWCADGRCREALIAGLCHVDGDCYEPGEADPDNPCRTCIPALAEDAFVADDAADCGDDDACTARFCQGGACQARALLDCDDGDDCTDDSCDPGAGCVHTPSDGPCDDGDACTLGDACVAGGCVAGDLARDCDDGNECTDDACAPASGCSHAPRGGACDDGDACTLDDACDAGSCQGSGAPDCDDDDDPCTVSWCDPRHGCLWRDAAGPCDDGDPCTLGDHCVGAVCVAGAEGLPCDDGEVCTDDRCVAGAGCAFEAASGPCDDGDACTVEDACDGGTCVGQDRVCDDAAPCTSDSCDPATGCVHELDDGAPCDDGSDCTADDRCGPDGCEGTPIACDDFDDCTVDRCVEGAGCVSEPLADDACALRLVITEPARGLAADPADLPDGQLVLRGYVLSPADPAPVVTVDDLPVTLVAADPPGAGPNGDRPHRFDFEVPLPPAQGMTVAAAAALDRLGRTDEAHRAAYLTTVFTPVTADDFEASHIGAGAAVALSQDFVDDDEATVDDLASLVDLMFSSLDLTSGLPSPVTTVSNLGCTFAVFARHPDGADPVSIGGVDTDLRIVDGGLALTESLSDFRFHFYLQAQRGNHFLCPGSSYGLAGANPAVISTTVAMALVDGDLVAAPQGTSVALRNFEVSADGFFINLLLNILQDEIRGTFETSVVDAVESLVGPLVGGIFSAFSLDADIPLPSLLPGADPVDVRLRSRIAAIDFVPDEVMTVTMDTAALVDPRVDAPVAGSLGFANCLAAPFTGNAIAFDDPARINVGFFDDMVGQVLHAAWLGGLVEAVLGPDDLAGAGLGDLGLTDVAVQISGRLPPLLTACRGRERGDPDAVALELGGLRVVADAVMAGLDLEVEAWVALRGTGAFVTVDTPDGGRALSLSIPSIDEVWVDIAEVRGGPPGAEALFGPLVRDTVVPALLGGLSFGDLFAFPLPSLDLSDPAAGIPAGTELQIVPDSVERTPGANTILRGTVRVP